ncbi:MAG: hypothetical protein Q8934_09465 [Bacillota bacterium]|nr:hypothetical protein [Bacillota bacterium]
MADINPIEYKGKVVDQRNDLTGPDDANKRQFPNPPKKVKIQQSNQTNQ